MCVTHVQKEKIFKSAVPKTLNPQLHGLTSKKHDSTCSHLCKDYTCWIIHANNNRRVESLHHKLLEFISWSPKAHWSFGVPANKPPSCSGQRLHLSRRLQTRRKPRWKGLFWGQSCLSCLLELSAGRTQKKWRKMFRLISVSPKKQRLALLQQPNCFQS